MQDKIQKSFTLFDASVELLKAELNISYLDALIESSENYLDHQEIHVEAGIPTPEDQEKLKKIYQEMDFNDWTAEEIRRWFQLLLLKGMRTDQLQPNHQLTPDSIGYVVAFLAEKLLAGKEKITLLDPVVGTGNLALTVHHHLAVNQIKADISGIDNDETLLALSAVGAQLQKTGFSLYHQDALGNLLVDPTDVVVADLPIGYYPLDENAQKFELHVKKGHSFAHFLLIEQSLNYLKAGGYGFFLVPENLFELEEGERFTKWLVQESYPLAILNLPHNLFKQKNSQKSLLVLQKKGNNARSANEILMGELPSFSEPEAFKRFMATFEQWLNENQR